MPEPPDTEPFRITVGRSSFDVVHARSASAINEPDTASGTVPGARVATTPADWASPAHASIGGYTVMTGQVTRAHPDDAGDVAVALQSALMLSEVLMPPMVTQNLTPQELVYAAARTSGFAEGDLRIDGLDDVSLEPMWVLAPLSGVDVERGVRVGVVELVPPDVGREMLRSFSPALERFFVGHLEDVAGFARVAVVARTLYDAEQEGLGLIDAAAAWLSTRLRYSWSHLPSGVLQDYTRSSTRVIVRRGEGVGVITVQGQRRWWRLTTVGLGRGAVAVSPDAQVMVPSLPAQLAPGDRQAMLALARAIGEADPVQRVTALWEAIEFYVGKRGPSRRFTRGEVAAIVHRATDGLDPDKARRVEDVLKRSLDQASTMVRLEHALGVDGVPFTEGDRELLRRLRNARNRAVHGSAAAPGHDDIDRAVAIVSRAMTTRIHRTAVKSSGDDRPLT